MKLKAMLFLLLSVTMMQAQNKKGTASPAAKPDEGIFAEIETSKGKILLQLEYQKTPVTVANFVSLAEGNNPMVAEKYKGKPFYDGLKFHRVIKDFMIQGGDPLGNGSGDPGYKFKDEIVADLKHTGPGILSMANAGPGTNGSQFFITHKETSWLNGKHTVFGHVVTGQDVVNAIAQDDVINKVTIIRKGKEAKKFDAAKIFGNYFAQKSSEDKKKAEEEAAAKKIADEKAATAKTAKKTFLDGIRATAMTTDSGLQYKIIKNGTGVKPADGTQVFIYYAGYLEDGSLFDSNFESVAKEYGRFDEARATQGGYKPFPFTAGNKSGLIPGFVEALEKMGFGDRLVAFIPSKLGYGEKGAGNVIPPNANIIFEIELVEKQ
ncbi:peptidylprolyl isomerase [Flavobacterium sp. MAH-1]|uniref:peptidylprolyl isomerase n=1 Tax=Flavobacterium agri TaxID=2743471 RepID=A0A7Y9C6U1_9FLAO|nr:peptidylprolyl isomerase [Flavobacterium agri]NUY82441.1 peptidylprolyl isomerase [Flavobacterium agri]NYA72465.1 peptidylprolyl isomerase [Flavobacterium agri]